MHTKKDASRKLYILALVPLAILALCLIVQKTGIGLEGAVVFLVMIVGGIVKLVKFLLWPMIAIWAVYRFTR